MATTAPNYWLRATAEIVGPGFERALASHFPHVTPSLAGIAPLLLRDHWLPGFGGHTGPIWMYLACYSKTTITFCISAINDQGVVLLCGLQGTPI
jgi:hypothetical protein